MALRQVRTSAFRALGSGLAVFAWIAIVHQPAAGAATMLVRAGGDLQEALNGARSGDVILLEAGATFVGNFVLPARPDGGVVTVRTSASDARLPSETTRVSPEVAYLLPKLKSPNGEPALRTAPAARGWRIVLVEFVSGGGGAGELLRLGDGGAAQASLSAVPNDIVIDRCYLHGDPGAPQKRGIALNSGSTTIQHSWISEIKSAGQDSQAIAGWNGPGPYRIFNNRLEAAGEVFLLGGADPAIRDLVPTDVVFAGNHVTRPTGWRESPWQVKNLLELKNARDVWIQGNLIENNWRAAQSGYAILFTPRNQDGRAPWATVEDVHFRFNVVRHVAAAISILGHDSPNTSRTCRGLEVANNLLYDVDGGAWGGGNGDFLLIGDGPADVTVEHNTVLQTGKIVSAYGGTPARPTPVPGFAFRFNVIRHNDYGVHGADHGVGNDTLSAYFPSAVFSKNVIGGGSASVYPSDNTFTSTSAFDRLFVNPANGDFHVTGASRARGGEAAAGADIDEVSRTWRAAQEGTWLGLEHFQRDRERVRQPKGKGGRE